MSALAEAAAAIAASGRPVLPVGPDKSPKTTHGLLEATTDPAQIAAWWARWPQANAAVRTGEPSGLVVLDVDGEEGAESLFELEREHGALPQTASVKTPRGGCHYYFEWPGVPVKTTASSIARGLDVRGDSGYVLVPPSTTAAGSYEWDSTVAPAAMPGWLLELVRLEDHDGKVKPTPPEVWHSMLCDGIDDGARNVNLTKLTGYLLRHYVAVDVTAVLVHLVNSECCRPPKPAKEVDTILDSIAAIELRRREGRS